MIPLVLPPLHQLGMLITRPAGTTEAWQQRWQQLGAHTLAWPTLQIAATHVVPTTTTPPTTHCDLLIFVSVHAVTHGAAWLSAFPAARLAAIGQATAAALEAQGLMPDAVPTAGSDSEALLQHPLLLNPPKHITIVRGVGGREWLRDALLTRGAEVTYADVYQRVPVTPDATALTTLTHALASDALDVVTATSVEVLTALVNGVPSTLHPSLLSRVLLCGSPRIADAAGPLGWRGERVVARTPQLPDMVDALCQWHTRQRSVA